jgi:hypothetical protein
MISDIALATVRDFGGILRIDEYGRAELSDHRRCASSIRSRADAALWVGRGR